MISLPQLTAAGVARGGALDEAQKGKVLEACQEFEAFFWNALLEVSGLGSEGDGSSAGGIQEGSMRGEVARSLSRTGSLGIADVIYRSLLPTLGVEVDETG